MKDEISEQDIRKALVEQLSENGSNDTKKKGKKKRKMIEKEHKNIPKKKIKKSKHKDKHDTIKEKEGMKSKTAVIQKPLRPPPKVIVFEEPGRSKNKEETPKMNHVAKKRKLNNEEEGKDEDFLEIARDVREFGMTGFSKKERRKYEQQKAQALGAKAPKGLKMPYKLYMSLVKLKKQKEEKRQELERAMGMNVKKKNQKKETTSGSSGWWTDKSSQNLDMSLGKYKKGVQKLSRDDIKRIKSNKR